MRIFRLLSPRTAPATFLLHLSMAIIIAGALTTHFTGIEGKLHLQAGAVPTDSYEPTSGPGNGKMPFRVELVKPVIDYYPGTTTPMDYASLLRITDQSGATIMESRTAMNKVMSCRGWRFFQSAISGESSTLIVTNDPIGTAVTYIGYALATLAMLTFLIRRDTRWRLSCRRLLTVSLTALAIIPAVASSENTPLPTIQKPLARNLGKIHVMWNDRICPLQTMARDVSTRLYGSDSYKGLTAEQVLSGWLFYYDDWMRDLSASGADDEKTNLANWIGSGAAFRIYPYVTASGTTQWMSLTEHRPSQMPLEQWQFMQTTMPRIASLVRHGKNIAANDEIKHLIDGQKRYAPQGCLPGEKAMYLERVFNEYIHLRPITFLLLALALAGLFQSVVQQRGRIKRYLPIVLTITAALSFIYVATALFIRAFVGGHLPLSNGHETMLTLSALNMLACLILGRKEPLVKSALLLVAALALLVAVIGEKNPQIGHLMPVLASPWLSIHVMLVILSYAAFAVMAILAAVALISSNPDIRIRCESINRAILVPAVFLLGAGIMAGAVWANQSWGRYWGWDPKETCALATLLVYALPIHTAAFPLFRRSRSFNVYILAAILAVLFTYFGANYLLPGLHSYA